MYTKLSITINQTTVTFHADELVALMLGLNSKQFPIKGLLDQFEREPCFIPKKNDFPRYLYKHASGDDWSYLKGKYDHAIFMPMHIPTMTSVGNYLYVADAMSSDLQDQDQRLDGWWLRVGGRSLYLKNQDKKTQFYISDFGMTSDIYDSMRKLVLETPWLQPPWHDQEIMQLSRMVDLNHFTDEGLLPPDDLAQIKKSFLQSSLDQLHQDYPSRSPQQIVAMYHRIEQDDDYARRHFVRYFHEVKFIQEVLRNTWLKLTQQNSSLVNEINDRYANMRRLRHQLLQRVVGMELMLSVNEGHVEQFFRPRHAFYDANSDGASYRAFADEVGRYLSTAQSSPVKLAQLLRQVLKGDLIPDETLDFLPNLVAAWFVAEAIRNRLSIPTSLMLLDIIENPEWLENDTDKTRELYQWRNVFLHPKEGEETECRDLYGDSIKANKDSAEPIIYFRGTHPMVHLDSRPDAASLLAQGKKLRRVRQKEGALMLHWLRAQLERALPNAGITPTVFDEINPDTYLRTPDYQELSLLMRQSKKSEKAINQDPKLVLKNHLLHEHIIPLLIQRSKSLENISAVNHAIAEALEQPNSIPPSFPSKTSYDFFVTTIEGANDLYSVILQTAAEQIQMLGIQHPLPSLVAEALIRNKQQYFGQVKDALLSMVLAQLHQVSEFWLGGLIQISENPEKFGLDIKGDLQYSQQQTKQLIIQHAVQGAAQSTLPQLPKISQKLQAESASFKSFVMMHWADANWFRERVQFIRALIELPQVTEYQRQRCVEKIHELSTVGSQADALYEGCYDEEIHNKLFTLYCDNARMLGASTGMLEIELLARILKSDIHVYEPFDQAKNKDTKPIALRTYQGIKFFQPAKIVKSYGENKIELFCLGSDQGYAAAKRSPNNKHSYQPLPSKEESPRGLITSFIDERAGLNKLT